MQHEQGLARLADETVGVVGPLVSCSTFASDQKKGQFDQSRVAPFECEHQVRAYGSVIPSRSHQMKWWNLLWPS
jgi:hypothetical protein